MKINGMLERAQLEILGADPSGAANLVNARIWKNSADGRVRVADGTKSVDVLLNDEKVILGTSGTVAENVRIHRAGVALLQFVTANDATAEGALSTNTAKLSFQFEEYTTLGRPAAGKRSRIIFDTDLNVLLVDDGTNWVSTANGTEISTCFINLGTASDTNAIVLSSDTKDNLDALTRKAGALYYATDESKYYGDDGLNLIDLGSGSGEGINYALNSDFEQNADEHVAYKDAAQEVPEDGIGGSPTLAIARSTVGPLRGKASGIITKPASNVQGEGVRVLQEDFEEADKGKINIISFDYDLSAAGALDGDFRVYFKDETNGVVYRINGEDVKAGKGTHYARVQVPIDCDNGSILIHCAATHTDGYDFKYDKVSIGPQKISYGGVKMYSVIALAGSRGSSGIVSNYTIQEENGSPLLVNTSGTWTCQRNNVLVTAGASASVTAADSRVGVYFTIGGSKHKVAEDSFDTSAGYRSSASGSFVMNKGDTVTFETAGAGSVANFDISLSAISQDNQTSEDFGGRDVEFIGKGNNGGSVTASVTDINWTSVSDLTASWNGTQFIAPETSLYNIEGHVQFTASSSRTVDAWINGVKDIRLNESSSSVHNEFSGKIKLNKGDILSFRTDVSSTLVNNTLTSHIVINKNSSSQQILETEIVAARYTSDSGQAISNGTLADFIYEDLDYDTHNAYNTSTGIYTVPISGYYCVKGKYGNDTSSNTSSAAIVVNGFSLSEDSTRIGSANNFTITQVDDELYLTKGDEVKIQAAASGASTASTQSDRNVFTISRTK